MSPQNAFHVIIGPSTKSSNSFAYVKGNWISTPADYGGVSIKEKSTKIQDDTRKRINEGLGELIKAHGNQKT